MANKRLNAIIEIGGAVSGTLRSAIGSTTGQLSKIGSEITKVKKNQLQLSDAIKVFGGMGKNVDNLRSKYAETVTTLDRLEDAQKRLSKVEQARTRNIEAQSKLYGQIGETVATAFAVGSTIYTAVSASSEFNYNMQGIGNTANMTKLEIGALKDEIMNTSKELGITVEKVQEAQGFLIAAGMDERVATKMLKPVGMAAGAAGAAIEDVSKAAYTLNDTLNISPTGMKDGLGILVQAGKEGNFEFKAMAEYLPTLGASFKALKMEGSEAIATMGASLQIARKGAGDESEAANNMRNFMAKILAPDTLKKAKKFGVDLYANITEAQKTGKNPFEVAMQDVIKMTKGGDQKLLGELFGDMQVQNFVRPMIQNWEEYEKIKAKALSGGADVIDQDFKSMGETTKSGVGSLVAAFGRLKISIGDTLEPVIKNIADAITPVIDGLESWVKNNPRLFSSLAIAASGLAAFKVGLLVARLALFAIRSPLLNITGMFAKVRAGLAMFKFSFGGLVPVIKQIGLTLLRTPWGLAAAVAIGAGLAIYKYWDFIKAFFSGFWQGLKQGIEPFTTAIGNLIDSTPFLAKGFEYVGKGVSIVVGWFKDLLTPVNASKEQIEGATNAGVAFGEFVGRAINLVLTPLRGVVNLFTWIFNNAGKLGGIIQKVSNFSISEKIKGFIGGAIPKQSATNTPAPPRSIAAPPPIKGTQSSFKAAPQTIFNQSTTINAAPGQSPDQIADAVMRKQKQAQGVQQRSSMVDWGYAQ